MRSILIRALPLSLLFVFLLVSCGGDSGQPTAPTIPDLPVVQNSAVLVYELDSKKDPGFVAFSSIGIPVSIGIDPREPKAPALIVGATLADYEVQISGTDKGNVCTLDFTILVNYVVNGFFNPAPKCDFDVLVTATFNKNDIEKSGTCSLALHEKYPAEALFIPPPENGKQKAEGKKGTWNISGSLFKRTIRNDDGTKITLELKNVNVPASTGCYFGG